jgi:transcriptional regulator with XRE-family HTH domain
MKLTIFGKAIRKLRIDRGLLLGDIAKKLNVSSAYLSSIELGERPIPQDFFLKIKNLSIFTKEELTQIEDAIIYTMKEFKFVPKTDHQKELIASLARSFDNLTEEQIKNIKNAINHKNN